MKIIPSTLNKGIIDEISEGVGEISGEMVWDRAKELALIDGQPLTNVHYGQALRELKDGAITQAILTEST